MVKQVKRFSGKKTKKSVTSGVVHINSTFNNTIVNITDKQGNTICWASAGGSGFKGAKKEYSFCSSIDC
jgi:small subunit ribosomal protein S11